VRDEKCFLLVIEILYTYRFAQGAHKG